jgi:hypothetical protein
MASDNHNAGVAYSDVLFIQNLTQIDQVLPEIIIMRDQMGERVDEIHSALMRLAVQSCYTVAVVRTVQVPPVHQTRGRITFGQVSHIYYLPPIHSLVALSSRFVNHH